NERFALFYPEKRPFFLEGLEQFDTPNRLIYTRQIVQPVAGAKLTGKLGSTAVAYLGAVDDRGQSASGNNPVFNLLRLRRDLGTASTAGLVYTDRIEGDDYNRVLGGDAMVVWKKIWFSQAQVVSSWTSDAGGARAGQFWAVTFADGTGRNYGNHFELLGATPEFATRSGFINRVDFVQARAANRFTWYGRPGALVEQVTMFIIQATAGWKPTPGVRIEARWTHVRLTRARDGSRFSTANIPRLKLEYQLSRAIFFRYVGQYFAQDQVALQDPRTAQPILAGGA